jgi:O-antigen biosynthesis protein
MEGIDFLALNVFLERPGELARYLAHLHVIADDRPVVISELGLAEVVHGVERQAEFLDAQLAEVEPMERPAPSSSYGPTNGL